MHRMAFGGVLLALIAISTMAQAGATDPPLRDDDFRKYVHSMETEADGSEVKFRERLELDSFTCDPISTHVAFHCVRFGCKKHLLGTGSLLQWSVDNVLQEPDGSLSYDAGAIDYTWSKSCIPQKEIKAEEKVFLQRIGAA